jgi:hypothetical protein
MIEELINDMSGLDDKSRMSVYTPEDTFARTRYVIGSIAISSGKRFGRFEDIRLPCIHKSDPANFHSSNVLPSVNHVELPLR